MIHLLEIIATPGLLTGAGWQFRALFTIDRWTEEQAEYLWNEEAARTALAYDFDQWFALADVLPPEPVTGAPALASYQVIHRDGGVYHRYEDGREVWIGRH